MFDFMDMDFSADNAPQHTGPYLPDAADCARCGLCVGVCPTYRLFGTSEETPRSRVRTLSKILISNQAISAEEHLHLNNCLQCRACEPACPSQMAYGQLFDQAQATLKPQPNVLGKLALSLVANKTAFRRCLPLLALYLKSGLQKPLRWTGLLKKLQLAEAEALLSPPALKPLVEHYPASGTTRGHVALFTGCVAEAFDRASLQASIKLLNAIGYAVTIPSDQGCCGAIHQHNGQSAARLIANNIKVFNALDVDAVLHTATGCGAMLSEYQMDDDGAAASFTGRLQDITVFLLAQWPEELMLSPLPATVAVHEPCSQRNVLKNQQAVYSLLAKIPELGVSALADNNVCCGAGGSYMLTHPSNAAQLRRLKHQSIAAAQADYVVSSNFGCAVFLADAHVKLLHPLSLLAKQLLDSP